MKHFWLISWILIIPCLNIPGMGISRESNSLRPGRIKDILVLSVADNADSTVAKDMEKELANELRRFNYTAESAIEHFGKNAFSKIREEETIKLLYPYDAVLIIALANEGQQAGRQLSPCNDFFWEYFDGMYSSAHGSQAKKTEKYFWEASFFEISNWKLQYRIKTSSFPSGLAVSRIPVFEKLIIRDMLAKHIIQSLPGKLKAF
jgi:hypothetical protein